MKHAPTRIDRAKKLRRLVNGAIPASKGVRNDMGPLDMMTKLLFPGTLAAAPSALWLAASSLGATLCAPFWTGSL
jgi:hypothetical protein